MGKNKKKGLTYAEAGVNIDAGEKEVELIKDCVKSTYTPGVVGDLGGFGGLYSLMPARNPGVPSLAGKPRKWPDSTAKGTMM